MPKRRLISLQVDRYGYAAFGLTVVPYIVMSLVNLAVHLVTPNYSTMYLVHSPEMDEAIDRGGVFEGQVGKVIPRLSTNPSESRGVECSGKFELNKRGNESGKLAFRVHGGAFGANTDGDDDASIPLVTQSMEDGPKDVTWLVERNPTGVTAGTSIIPVASPFKIMIRRRAWAQMIGNIPVIIVAGLLMILCFLPMLLLTRFEKRESTVLQRFWTLFWFACNGGWVVARMVDSTVPYVGMCFISLAAFIGGCMTVDEMLKEHGYCIRV